MHVSLTTFLACLLASAGAAPAPQKLAPIRPAPKGSKAIPGKYIVKLKTPSSSGVFGILSDGVLSTASDTINSIVNDVDVRPQFVSSTLGSFSSKLSDKELQKLRKNSKVEYIEEDSVVSISEVVNQTNAPWGIIRISSNRPNMKQYRYDSIGGSGTCAYIIDTGIDAKHPEFEGRALQVTNLVTTAKTDDNGHGTHVAGTIGSKTYGVAKKTKLFGVKVLDEDGRGATSTVVAAMDFILKDRSKRSCPKGIVVNASLSGATSQALNDAADALVNAGLLFVAAAGNGVQGVPVDASSASPASAPKACTVGATDRTDQVASFSNYGAVLDLYAPGVDIPSILPGGRVNISLSGTSMAAPHVSGLGAYFMSLGKASGSNMCSYMKSKAQKGVLDGVPKGTSNALARNGLVSRK